LTGLVWRHGEKPVEQAPATTSASTQTDLLPSTRIAAPPSASQAAQPATSPSRRQFIAATAVNVRAYPDNQSDKLFVLQQGEPVELVATNANWIEVKNQSGETGWAYSKFLAPASPN
jgi:SH3-like domain-containing protein